MNRAYRWLADDLQVDPPSLAGLLLMVASAVVVLLGLWAGLALMFAIVPGPA